MRKSGPQLDQGPCASARHSADDLRSSVRLRSRAALSLVELLVAVTLIGILSAIAMPSFRRAVDQSRADIAGANLRAIWSAERCYWLEYRTYTSDLTQLQTMGLLDPTIVTAANYYVYSVASADNDSFVAVATRTGSAHWSGQFVIDETGVISGSIGSYGEASIAPAFQ